MSRRAAMFATTMFGVSAAVFPLTTDPSPRLIWNASASVPIGLYVVKPANQLQLNNLVVVRLPEDAAAFLAEGGYLPRGVPILKHIFLRSPVKPSAVSAAPSASTPLPSATPVSATAVAARCPSGRAAASSRRAKSSS